MQNLIPTLDWKVFKKGETLTFVGQAKEAFLETGFFLLKNHPISFELLTRNRKLFEIFFKDLSLTTRTNYIYPDIYYQKGYTPLGTEKGEFANRPDNKHFYQLGDIHDNPFVQEIPDLQQTSGELYNQFSLLYRQLMEVIAMSLNLDRYFFDHELGNSIMRHIHYPAQDNPVVDDGEPEQGGNLFGMCAEMHTDINDITILHATEPGLQLRHKNQWIPVLCNPDTVIINIGDMLWHLTGGRYKSGTHRVVCDPGVERFSSPFFGHRVDEASVIPIFDCDLSIFKFKTEGEFLAYRLQQIMLKK